MPFTSDVVRRAWIRQGGLCAHCGKGLVWDGRDQSGMGSWHAHHRKPEAFVDGNSTRNCVILCCGHPDCHLKVGHGGDPEKRREISDAALPYFHAGET